MAGASGATPSFSRVVWPLAIAETVVWAAMFYSFPALLPAWEADLGWSKTEFSAGFTLALVVSAALAPVAGRLIDHGLGRQVFAGGALLGAVALIVLSQVTELWQFTCVWFVLGIAMSSSLYEACFALLTRTMGGDAKRAITLVSLVAGFAGTVSFPSAHGLVAAIGWRGTVLVFAAAIVVVALPLIWIGCRGAERHGEVNALPASKNTAQVLGVTKTWTFWLLVVAYAMFALEHGLVITHILPILDDRGLHPDAAVLAASMIGPMQVAGRLAMMAAERHVSTLTIALTCYLAMGVAVGSLFGAGLVPGLVVVFVIGHGAGNGVASIIRPIVTAELLGRRNFGVVSGLLAVAFVGGVAVAPTVAALVWQAGGYDLVLLLAVSTTVVGFLALSTAWWHAKSRSRG